MSYTVTNPVKHVDEERGYLPPGFITSREKYYVNRQGKTVYLGCSDDRDPTEKSAEKLAASAPADTMNILDGYASIYGAVAGIAKNIIVAGIAQYGPEFIQTTGGFMGVMSRAISCNAQQETDNRNHSGPGMLFTLHSAANTEASESVFDPEATSNLGCAYAAGVGATTVLLTDPTYPLVRDVAREDQRHVFGNDNSFDALLEGHRIFLESGTENRAGNFALSRADYASMEVQIMILAGRPHVAAKKSGVISNFNLHTVRSATAAVRNSDDFYNLDIAGATVATLRAFKEYDLDPELLMRAYQLDSTPVRAVLASHDSDADLQGQLDPRNLAMGVLGYPQAALADIRTQSY